MTAPNPLVSVIVPAFNAAATLEETLGAVAAQTYRPIELLVVDDGSSDATGKIAEAFCRQHDFAQVIVQANAGVAAARNRAIAVAKGDYIAPLDADDIWHETYLAKLIAKARAAPEPPIFVYAHTRVIDGNSQVMSSAGAYQVEGPAIFALQYCNVVGSGSGMVMDAQACRAVGGYSEALRAEGLEGCEDYLLQLQLAALGPIARVGEYLIGYRVACDSMSSNKLRMLASDRRARELFAAGPSAPPMPRLLQRWIAARNALRQAEAARTLGRPLVAVRAIARALVLDPVTVAHAFYSRLLTFLTARAEHERASFYEIDPRARDASTLRIRHFSRHQADRLALIAKFDDKAR